MTDLSTKEVELYGIRAVVPDHPRFGVHETGMTFDNKWFELLSNGDKESACCIAIVHFEGQMKSPNSPESLRLATAAEHNADAWRSILRKSKEARL